MKKIACTLLTTAFLAVAVTTPVMAKTTTQIKQEKKGADAKAKTKAKSDARKAKKK